MSQVSTSLPSRPEADEASAAHRALAARARSVFRRQAEAIAGLADRVDESFGRATRLLLRTPGHVVFVGLGKSGLVGRKISATFASTGTPSFFVHATEALHGDLGKVTQDDTAVLLSNSGETAEVLEVLTQLRMRGIPSIAIVGKLASSLGRRCDVALDASVPSEVCPNNLAPTSSTLAALAMGDALAVCLMQERAFRADDFARLHVGGQLGRRLRTCVADAMRTEALPTVSAETKLAECLGVAARGRLGLAIVVDGRGRPLGVLADDDLVAPTSAKLCHEWLSACAAERMQIDFLCTRASTMVAEIDPALETAPGCVALVLDAAGVLVGVVERAR